jgi:hypothetical protein
MPDDTLVLLCTPSRAAHKGANPEKCRGGGDFFFKFSYLLLACKIYWQVKFCRINISDNWKLLWAALPPSRGGVASIGHTSPLVAELAPFYNTQVLEIRKPWNPIPRLTVTARASSNLPHRPTNGFVTMVMNFWVEQCKNFYNQWNNHHVLKEGRWLLFNNSQLQVQQFNSAHRKCHEYGSV